MITRHIADVICGCVLWCYRLLWWDWQSCCCWQHCSTLLSHSL